METVLIGLPSAGRSTIFDALTGEEAASDGGRGSQRTPRIVGVAVPDPRLDRLAEVYRPKKVTAATVFFRDVSLAYDEAGSLVPSGLGEARRADALTIVVRAFENEAVPRPRGSLDPLRDLGSVLDSLVLADLEVTEKRLSRLAKEGKRDGREPSVLRRAADRLGSGELLGESFFCGDDARLFSGFGFLTAKPIVLVVNTGERSVAEGALAALAERAAERGIVSFAIRGDLEAEIARLESHEQADFLRDLGIAEPARERFLRHVYASLRLVSFLTAGEPEVRAWSIREGTTAARAAGVIHTDLERGFIRAEVAWWEDLVEHGGWTGARRANRVRLEGKDYVLKDGDVILVRFNV